jgi:hypothetical protein
MSLDTVSQNISDVQIKTLDAAMDSLVQNQAGGYDSLLSCWLVVAMALLQRLTR